MVRGIGFSLLMAVYDGDDPAFLHSAYKSVLSNSILPDEIVLVIDGPINERLTREVENFTSAVAVTLIRMEKNEGLGCALRRGVLACKYDWVARFDSDDICSPDRFEKQLRFIEENPDVDAFSAPIVEFEKELTKGPFVMRDVPRGHSAVVSYAKWRNPLNHMSVMFRKSVALEAGNYQDEPYFEDYSLWLRMILIGAHLDNMADVVVYARAGDAVQNRRGGVLYIKRELSMHRKMLRWGVISFSEMLIMLSCKSLVRILPGRFRFLIYSVFARKRNICIPDAKTKK